ncbi:MAG: hypothetical protein ACJ75B_21380 [Flavisolibacter sp.]
MNNTIGFCIAFSVLLFTQSAIAQDKSNADSSFKPSGKLWGYTFGDYYYKAHSDSLNRGGANQYTGIEKGRNAFQIRRVYLGYTYDIAPKFTAELLLAAEDNITTSTGITSGDLLADNKLSLYIKLANLRWKNIWKGTDLVVGQVATPAFPLLTEPIWGYRAVERTVADIRRTPSFDLGAALQGIFDTKANFGYNLMVGNGTGAKPENDRFKWFYGDVFAKFLDKRVVVDLYADYQRLNNTATWHHSRNMIKGFVAYTTPAFTVGVEAFINHGQNDVVGVNTFQRDTISANAKAISAYVKGSIVKDKLGFFTRMDSYNPDVNFDSNLYSSYKGLTSNYEPNNKELFFTAGLDFTPVKNVHFIPNIWYNRYTSNQSGLSGSAYRDHDLVYRLTFYYVYR